MKLKLWMKVLIGAVALLILAVIAIPLFVNANTFRPVLEKALAAGGPYVISVEVPTDSEVSPWSFIHPTKNI